MNINIITKYDYYRLKKKKIVMTWLHVLVYGSRVCFALLYYFIVIKTVFQLLKLHNLELTENG